MFFHMVYKSGQIFLPFCHNPRVWRTDRQTDRRTERILIARPRLHSMQRGKNTAAIDLLLLERDFPVSNLPWSFPSTWEHGQPEPHTVVRILHDCNMAHHSNWLKHSAITDAQTELYTFNNNNTLRFLVHLILAN